MLTLPRSMALTSALAENTSCALPAGKIDPAHAGPSNPGNVEALGRGPVAEEALSPRSVRRLVLGPARGQRNSVTNKTRPVNRKRRKTRARREAVGTVGQSRTRAHTLACRW